MKKKTLFKFFSMLFYEVYTGLYHFYLAEPLIHGIVGGSCLQEHLVWICKIYNYHKGLRQQKKEASMMDKFFRAE